MNPGFFVDWALWVKMCFVLGAAIVITVIGACFKLVWTRWRLQKYTAIAEARKIHLDEMRRNGALIQLQGEDIPFGIRAIQSGIKIEGVWLSKQNSPAASIRSWDPRSSPIDLGPPLGDCSQARPIGGDATSSRLSVLLSDDHREHLHPTQATTSPEFGYASSIQSEFLHVAGNQYLQESNPVPDVSESTRMESVDGQSPGMSPRGEHEEWLANDARRRRHNAIELAPETARAHYPFDQYVPDFPVHVRPPRDCPGSYRIDRGAEGMAWSSSESRGIEAKPQFPSISPSGPINPFKSQEYSGTSFSNRVRNQYYWRGESEGLASTGHISTDQTSRRMGTMPSYEVSGWMEASDRPSRRRPLSIESQVDMPQIMEGTPCLSSLSSGSLTPSFYADCESIGDTAMAEASSTLEPEQNVLSQEIRAVQQADINKPAHTRRTSRIVNSGFEVLPAGSFKSPSASEDMPQRNLAPATNVMNREAEEDADEHPSDGRRAPSKRLITPGYHQI